MSHSLPTFSDKYCSDWRHWGGPICRQLRHNASLRSVDAGTKPGPVSGSGLLTRERPGGGGAATDRRNDTGAIPTGVFRVF